MITNSFLSKLNQKYGSLNKKQLAITMLKKSTDIGTAIVNILSATGIAGFKFHVPETEIVKFENDITDHYIDTNSAVQDHIVQKPITITLTGLVGDYFYSNNQLEDLLALVVPTMTLVKEFLPEIRNATSFLKLKKYNSTTTIGTDGKIVSGAGADKYNFSAMDIFSLFQSLYKLKSAQTRAFLFFECMWKSRALFSVETTWKRYDNMVIQSLQPRRDKNADITEFSITFKQISTTQTLTETAQEYKNRVEQQMADTVNKGVEKGELVSMAELDKGIVNV